MVPATPDDATRVLVYLLLGLLQNQAAQRLAWKMPTPD